MEEEGVSPIIDSYGNYSIDATANWTQGNTSLKHIHTHPPSVYSLNAHSNTLNYSHTSLATTTTLVVTYACLQLFYTENQIAANYIILPNQMVYYISFAIVIAPFLSVYDITIMNTLELIFGWKIYDYLAYQRYRFTVREHRWMLRNVVVDESISGEFIILDLLCFSSQYYYLMSMCGFGMMMGVLGLETYFRVGYNPFTDPTFILFFVVIAMLGKVLERIMYFFADIQVRRLNWRGLWATKLIEGNLIPPLTHSPHSPRFLILLANL